MRRIRSALAEPSTEAAYVKEGATIREQTSSDAIVVVSGGFIMAGVFIWVG
jgi:hypothetical protein